MRLLLFILTTYCCAFTSLGQHYYVSGVIRTTDSLPADNVLLETEVGPVSTNAYGQYRFETSNLPTAITARYPGYPTNDLYIDAPAPGLDSVKADFVLTKAVHDMEEIVVTNERVDWVYPATNFHVIDFVLLPDGQAMCGSEERAYSFRVTDAQGNVISSASIREHPQLLVKDCENTIHVLYQDSAYAFDYSEPKARVLNVVSMSHFRRAYEPCIASFDSVQVLAFRSAKDWGTVFGYSENRLARGHLLYMGTSRKYLIRVEEYKTYLLRGGKSRRDKTDNDILEIQKRTKVEYERQQREEKKWGKKPLPVAVKINDSLQIFDFLNDSVVVYDKEMRQIRRFALQVHTNRHFNNQIFTDVNHKRLFAALTYEGMGRILELNPLNGKIIGETKLAEHIYPYHFQVRDGQIYYLYQHYLDRAITFMYKQPLNPPRI